MTDIGNNCVCCNKDTSFGSGRVVNRIPADADYESLDDKGNTIFADGQYRDGYLCPECAMLECDRCGEGMAIDEDICPHDVYGEDNVLSSGNFSDGAYLVHYDCLTKEEENLLRRKNDE